jgi:hypothetical protein
MTKTADLLARLARVGNKLDSATDPETMRFLIRGRKALKAAVEARRPAEPSNRGASPWNPK